MLVTKGILLFSIENLFQQISNSSKLYTASCSYIEIYNENVHDLLSLNAGESLTVNEDPVKGFYIKTLSEKTVRTYDEAVELILIGENARKYSSTDKNAHSSRSHIIFRVNILGIKPDNTCFESCINFVDLAGSERLNGKKLQNAETIAEGKHINTSLFYLCSVIHKLAEKPQTHTHIPYRNSNLTKILRNSIGGNSLTNIVCTASPSLFSYEMTQSTLQLASLAKTIVNKVWVNVKMPSADELISFFSKDIRVLREQLNVEKCNNAEILKNIGGKTKKKEKFICRCESERKKYGWMAGVGDLAGMQPENDVNFSDGDQRFKEFEKKIKELTGKCMELQEENKLLQEKIMKKTLESEESIEKYNEQEAKQCKLTDYIDQLLRKIKIYEGKYFESMTHEAIKQLEHFYFSVIDTAKEFRASSKKSERLPFKPISENSLQQKSSGSAIEILVDFDKENMTEF